MSFRATVSKKSTAPILPKELHADNALHPVPQNGYVLHTPYSVFHAIANNSPFFRSLGPLCKGTALRSTEVRILQSNALATRLCIYVFIVSAKIRRKVDIVPENEICVQSAGGT